MNRALLGTLWIGAVAAAIAIVLQMSGLLASPAAALSRLLRIPPNETIDFANFVFVILLSFAVGWTMLTVETLARQLGLFLLILVELLGAAWVLQTLGINFAPWPAMVALFVATVLVLAFNAMQAKRRRRAGVQAFAGRLHEAGLARLAEREAPDLSQPRACEASFVFCEIANEADLVEDLPAADCAHLVREFIESASRHFLQAGGYLQAADGEGVRVLFGFPHASPQHAVEASQAVLAFRDDFYERAAKLPETLGRIDLRAGLSSGTIVASRVGESLNEKMVISGEPLEIARRLARANQVYGSQILLDPRGFSAARPQIVARPLDFLRSAAPHDRLEVYELLGLSDKASPEDLARRDRFWTAIVYFRERRWNEAFAEFHRARGENGAVDQPLQWYLRRLEPLCLRMTTEPSPVTDSLVPF
ncbi:MAG: adenylate/guanylate cyclase domain-containing protein [Chthoniobacterales bacterium]